MATQASGVFGTGSRDAAPIAHDDRVSVAAKTKANDHHPAEFGPGLPAVRPIEKIVEEVILRGFPPAIRMAKHRDAPENARRHLADVLRQNPDAGHDGRRLHCGLLVDLDAGRRGRRPAATLPNPVIIKLVAAGPWRGDTAENSAHRYRETRTTAPSPRTPPAMNPAG